MPSAPRRSLSLNLSSNTSADLDISQFIVPGVQSLPDGCLLFFGETLTPVSFSLISTVSVQVILALLAIINDPTRFVYFSAHSLRLSVVTVIYLFSHFVHFCYICYSVTHLPPAYDHFNHWERYTLFYIRIWNSGYFAAAFAPLFVVIIDQTFRSNVRRDIEDIYKAHWEGKVGLRSGEAALPLVNNPLRVTVRASVKHLLGQASTPSPSPAPLAAPVVPRPASLKSTRSTMNLLLAPATPGAIPGPGGAPRRARRKAAAVTAAVSASPKKSPLSRLCEKWPFCRRPRNYVPREIRRAYWQGKPVGLQVEYLMWRQWAYGKRDEIIPLFPDNPTSITPANASWLLFIILLLILAPSVITHIIPMAVFFILAVPTSLAVGTVILFILYQLLKITIDCAAPFGPDPRAITTAAKVRTSLFMLFSILTFCLPTFFLGLTLLTLYYHGAILYSAGLPIDYFGTTRVWWRLTNLRCFFGNLASTASVFDRTGGLGQVLTLLSYLV